MTTRTTTRSVRRTAVLAMAGLSLAACGSDGGALPVIRLGGGGQGAVNAASTADAAGKMSMMAWLDYELGADLPALDDEAEGWRITADVDAARVSELAALLGVDGDVVAQTPEMGGGWMVGANDGSTDSLWASPDGQGWWSYSAAWDDTRLAVSCPEVLVDPVPAPDAATVPESAPPSTDTAGAGSGDASSEVPAEPECVAPEPPANVPTAREAEALFRQLLADLRVDASNLTFEPYADEWGASVYATRQIDGAATPLTWSASYGADASLTYASGTFGELESIGMLPRIGTDAAFERLTNRDGWWGWSGAAPMARDTVGGDAAASSGTAVAAPVDGGPAIDVMPPESGPEDPSPITVTIVDVAPSLWSVWDVDSTVWLVPAYDFIDADGGRYTVPAVPDEMIDDSAVTAATIDTAVPVTDPTDPVNPEDTAVDPTIAPEGPMATAPEFPNGVDSLVGMPEADAAATIEAAGFTMRVVARDGESFPVTQDYRLDRVNVTIVDGTVSQASIG